MSNNNNITFGNTAIKGFSWILLQKGSIQGVTFISTVILARLLDASAFGLVALTGTFMAFAQMFIDQGLGVAIVQRKELQNEHLDAVFWMNMTAAFLLFIIGYVLAVPISRLFNEPDFVPVFRVLLLTLPVSAINLVQRSLLQKKMAFRALAMPNMIGITVGAIVGVLMALAGKGVWSLVAQSLSVQVVAIPLLWAASDWRPQLRFSVFHFRQVFSFSLYVLFSQLIGVLNHHIDKLLIGYFIGSSTLGIYTVATRLLTNIYGTLNQAVGTVFYPMLSERQYNRHIFHDCLDKALRLTSLVVFPVFTGLALVSVWVLPMIYGDKWTDGIPVMQVMAFMYLAYVLYRIVTTGITAAGNPKIILQLHGFSLVFHIVLVYLGAQAGIVYVAVAYVARVYVMLPLYLVALRKTTGFSLKSFAKAIYPATIAATCMAVIVLTIRAMLPAGFTSPVGSLISTICIGILSYFLGVWLAAPRWTRTTLTRTATILKNRFRKKHP